MRFLCCLLDSAVDFGEEVVDVFAVVEGEVAAFGTAVFWGGCCVVSSEEDLGLGCASFGVVGEVPRVLFLGICLDFYYCLRRVLVPK
ncbi:hypothetical protein, partial [Corynebacterium marquesiae]|uniref:hypothetical protein n=1 Tax=Corynebacterium marquesiae TaxID=2913503 RepID=UPI00254DD22F